MIRARLFSSLFFICFALQSDADDGVGREVMETRKVAFVIGNAAYSGQAKLKNPINDADSIARLLTSRGFSVQQFTDLKTSNVFQLRQSLEREIDSKSVLFFYYAGHGIQLDGRNYLIPVDARTDSPDGITSDSLYLGDILAAIDKRRPRLAAIVLDACRDNPFGAYNRNLRVSGLARVDPPSSTVVFYATRPGGVAADGEGEHGLFTDSFLTQSSKEDATIEVLFRRVSKEVYLRSNGEQEPWVEGVIREEFSLASLKREPIDNLNPSGTENKSESSPNLTSAQKSTDEVALADIPAPNPVDKGVRVSSVISKQDAFALIGSAFNQKNLQKDVTYFHCRDGVCQSYVDWAGELSGASAAGALKTQMQTMRSSRITSACGIDLRTGECSDDGVDFKIVSPLMLFNSGFFEGFDLSDVRATNSGGMSFMADFRGGSKWFGTKKTRVNCQLAAGRLEFRSTHVDLEIARTGCMGVAPSTVKVDFNVVLVDMSTREYYVTYDVGMFAGVAGAKSSGLAKIRFE